MIIYSGPKGTILIDESDKALLNGWKVYPHKMKSKNTAYAVACRWDAANKKGVMKKLHRMIMGFPAGVVCHLNGNGLDCRRENLRVGTVRDNANSFRTKRKGAASRFRGVHANRSNGKPWTAMFFCEGNHEEDAARAYDAEAGKRFGEFAHLNFPKTTLTK
jgi:hypothetical protein